MFDNDMGLIKIIAPATTDTLPAYSDVREVLLWLNRSIKTWNNYAEETNCPIRLKLPASIKAAIRSRNKQKVRQKWGRKTAGIIKKIRQGVLYDTQVMSCIDVINEYLKSDNDIAILGAPQLGKTVVFLSLFFFLPMLEKLKNRTMAAASISVPNYTNIYEQMFEEARYLLVMYGDVEFIYVGGTRPKSTTINAFVADNDHVFGNDGDNWFGAFMGSRNPSGYRNWCEKAAAVARAGVKCMIGIIDESHFGSGVNQLQEKWENGDLDTDSIKEYFPKYRRICVSATLSEQMCQEAISLWSLVPMWVPKTYNGPTKYLGVSLKRLPGVEERLPEIVPYNEFFSGHGIELDYPAYHSSIKEVDGQANPKAVRKKFISNFARVFVQFTTKKHPVMFCRPSRGDMAVSKELAAGLKEELERLDLSDEYHVLDNVGFLERQRFFKKGSRGLKRTVKRTLKEILKEDFIDNGLKVIVVNDSRSTMGDSYPKECKYFIDFTNEPGTWNSELQGTFGRSCGNDKESVCLFGPDYTKSLIGFLARGCSDRRKKMCSRTHYGDEQERGRPSEANLEIRFVENGDGVTPRKFGEHEKVLEELFENLKWWVNGGGDSSRKMTEGKKGLAWNEVFREDVASNDVIDQISKLRGHGLAHWGELDSVGAEGSRKKKISGGDDKIGIRVVADINQWRGKTHRASAKNNRMDDPSGDLIYPQVVVTAKPGCICKRCGYDTRDVFLAGRLTFNSQGERTDEEKRLLALRQKLFGKKIGRYLKDSQFKAERPCCWDRIELTPVVLMLRRRKESYFPPSDTVVQPAPLHLKQNSRHYEETLTERQRIV